MSAAVKGWCPGLLRPMLAGDGLLVRLRPPGGILGAEALAVVARAARELGNGLADLTSQANLQLRGLTPDGAATLAQWLRPLGLVDDSAASEARRNIVVSPLGEGDFFGSEIPSPAPAGAASPVDLASLLRDLAAHLRDAHELVSLPPKFTFLIDEGGPLPLGDVPASIRFEAMVGAAGPLFLVKLAGTSATAPVVGQCARQSLAPVAISLARGQNPVDLQPIAAADIPPPRATAQAQDCLRQFTIGTTHFLGALAPFGRLTAAMLAALAEVAGQTERPVRLTPWRCVLVPLSAPADADSLGQRLARAGFILDPSDPRARVAACVGSPACTSATTAVREDAALFAQALSLHGGTGIALHVSGCSKGCAQQKAAPITLVARAGSYDLVLAGNAQARPQETGHTRATALLRLREIFAEPEPVA